MTGASASVAGKAGMVPEPKAGEQDYVLTGDGVWREKAPKADKADKADRDGNGNVITDTYLPLSGGTMTGPLYDKNKSTAFLPVGAVFAFAANSTPAGCLLCNGAAVSRTTYADLFAAIGTTYGAGNGSTTFNLPNLTNKFIQGSGTAGTVKAAGLPNTTGLLRVRRYGNNDDTYTTANGVFTKTKNDGGPILSMFSSNSVDSYNLDSIRFSMANSNAVYGASSTVQPPAVTMCYYIKY